MDLFYFQILINSLMLSSNYILISLGLTLIFSIMRIVNFAHGELFMAGGFVFFTFFDLLHFPVMLSLLLSICFLFLIGLGIEQAFFKPFRDDPLNSLVISLGLAILLQNIFLILFGGLEKSVQDPIGGVFNLRGIFIPKSRVVVILFCLIFTFALFAFLKWTRLGYSMRAVAQDREASALQGIRIDKISYISFGIGSALAALGGALVGILFDLSPFMGVPAVTKAFIVVILGGMGSLNGTVIAGIILGFSESIISSFTQTSFADMISFLLLIVILIFRPQGIMGKNY